MAKLRHTSIEVMPNLLDGELLALLNSKGITLVYAEDDKADRPFTTIEEYLKATSRKTPNQHEQDKNKTDLRYH